MLKSLLKGLGLTLVLLVVLLIGFAGSVYLGWAPVPGFVTGWWAQAKGLSGEETEALNRTVNLWGVLKTSPEAPLFDRAIALVTQGGSEREWARFAAEAWPQVSAETKRRIQEQWAIAPEDFQTVDAVVTRQVAVVEREGSFDLTTAEATTLTRFADRYHLTRLLEKLRTSPPPR